MTAKKKAKVSKPARSAKPKASETMEAVLQRLVDGGFDVNVYALPKDGTPTITATKWAQECVASDAANRTFGAPAIAAQRSPVALEVDELRKDLASISCVTDMLRGKLGQVLRAGDDTPRKGCQFEDPKCGLVADIQELRAIADNAHQNLADLLERIAV